jgi:cobalt-zinc-cadmium efflux system membrane fusion protein
MKNIPIFFVLLFFQACQTDSKETKTQAPSGNDSILVLSEKQIQESKISLGKIEERKLSTTLKVNGKIDVPPQNLLSVSAPLGGYLKSTKLLPGMHLRKGEVIAVLEDQQYIQLQQDYLTTQARLEMAEQEYKRQGELNQSKASSDKVFQQAKADYQSLKINLSGLGQKLRLIDIDPEKLTEQNLSKSITIKAPFDGFVSKVNVNIGKYVNPSDVLFELVNPNDIHLNLKVFEKDLIQLEIGQKLHAYTNSNPSKKYLCEIILISQDIALDRTAEVHCHFENYAKSLLPGMYMNADIQLKDKPSLALPEEAVLFYEGKNHVFVRRNRQFILLQVEIGEKEGQWVEIKNGADLVHETIVIQSAYTLLMELKNKAD